MQILSVLLTFWQEAAYHNHKYCCCSWVLL